MVDSKLYESVAISLRIHGRTYTVEGLDWDINGKELLDEFKGLMVASGFPPSIMNNENGYWEWHEND